MEDRRLTGTRLEAYAKFLREEERAAATVEKYLRDAGAFAAWLGGGMVTREAAAGWREHLLEEGLSPVTVNAKLSAVNGLFRFLGWEELRVRFLKVQRRAFRDAARELSRQEYARLLEAARALGRERTGLLLETICATGIRVSEVQYITVEAAVRGRVEVALKGKIRTVLLPSRLCRKLLKYAKKEKIVSGEIFLSENGKGISRCRIWREMKRLCQAAGVEPSKVFPHNLRHLFASAFYQATGDIVKLADVLGHSSINTTRIYLVTTGAEHARCLERLGLVS